MIHILTFNFGLWSVHRVFPRHLLMAGIVIVVGDDDWTSGSLGSRDSEI